MAVWSTAAVVAIAGYALLTPRFGIAGVIVALEASWLFISNSVQARLATSPSTGMSSSEMRVVFVCESCSVSFCLVDRDSGLSSSRGRLPCGL